MFIAFYVFVFCVFVFGLLGMDRSIPQIVLMVTITGLLFFAMFNTIGKHAKEVAIDKNFVSVKYMWRSVGYEVDRMSELSFRCPSLLFLGKVCFEYNGNQVILLFIVMPSNAVGYREFPRMCNYIEKVCGVHGDVSESE